MDAVVPTPAVVELARADPGQQLLDLGQQAVRYKLAAATLRDARQERSPLGRPEIAGQGPDRLSQIMLGHLAQTPVEGFEEGAESQASGGHRHPPGGLKKSSALNTSPDGSEPVPAHLHGGLLA